MELTAVAVSQSPEEKFREYLSSRPRPQRYTQQQRDMVRYIFSKHNHFEADRLFEEMRQTGLNVSRATVYRTLSKLVDAGLLRCLETSPKKKYEHEYGYPQHEHMQCQLCGKMIEFQDPRMETILRDVARSHSFQPTGHTFIIRGTCSECNRSRVTKRRLDLI
ncbi:MAG TPA: transcriptional repressor [Gemmataceae bacterium]|nr:transcriptional repressor [Gemmataceae bacterium]